MINPALLNQLDGDQPFCNEPTELPPGRRRAAAADWLQTGLGLTAVVVAMPLNQYTWPNPVTRAPLVESRTWLQSRDKLAAQDAIPPQRFVYDYPLPPPKPPIVDNRTWLQGRNLLAGQDAIPPNRFVYDYPLPVVRAAIVDNRSLVNSGLALTVTPPVKPFLLSDWPLPPPKAAIVDNRSWLQGRNLLAGQDAIPPNRFQYDLSLPATRRKSDVSFVNAGLGVASVAPFSQVNWPLPDQRKRADGTWVNRALGLTAVVATAPFAQTDWPLYRATRRPDGTWLASGMGVLSTPPGTPLRPFDWPIPEPRSRAPDKSFVTTRTATPPVAPVVDDGFVVGTQHKSDIGGVATQFTRKRWEEMRAAEKAAAALEKHAETVPEKAKPAVEKAVAKAEKAIAAVGEAKSFDPGDLERLTYLLRGATHLVAVDSLVRAMAKIKAEATTVQAEAEDDDDEIALKYLFGDDDA